MGSLRAHFDLNSGPSTACALAAQFVCNNTSLSGADFELCGLGYRLSLVKKQIIAGKYKCSTFKFFSPSILEKFYYEAQ